MVCAKCQKRLGATALATPGVKKKTDMYYGSPAGSKTTASAKTSSATLGDNGVGKSKLLSKSAKNPYASYSGSCTTCKKKIEADRKFCQTCAYKSNACAACGKSNTKTSSAAPTVAGQKFTLK